MQRLWVKATSRVHEAEFLTGAIKVVVDVAVVESHDTSPELEDFDIKRLPIFQQRLSYFYRIAAKRTLWLHNRELLDGRSRPTPIGSRR